MASRREDLEALRARLVAEAAEADVRDLPAVSRELRAVWADLETLPAAEGTVPADEIARRREERRRKAAGE